MGQAGDGNRIQQQIVWESLTSYVCVNQTVITYNSPGPINMHSSGQFLNQFLKVGLIVP